MLNDAYAVNAAGHGVKWDFKLMGIKRVTGPSMCDKDAEQQLKALHRQGGANALNLYFTDLGDCGLLGFSTWPWQVGGGSRGLVCGAAHGVGWCWWCGRRAASRRWPRRAFPAQWRARPMHGTVQRLCAECASHVPLLPLALCRRKMLPRTMAS